MNSKLSVKRMVLLAMLAAIAYMLVSLIRIPVVLFLSYEPKDVIITIGGFLLGPAASFIISFVVSLLEMVTISQTGPIGCLMNLLSTCSFACTAGFVYKKKRTMSGAIGGLALGSVIMVITMLLWNWLITPLYMTGTSRSDIAAMLVPVFLPFNLLKASLNSAFILLLYKPVVTALRRTGLIPSPAASTGSSKLWVSVFAGILLITCILLILVFQGKI